MTTYTNVFGGTVVYPAEVSYRAVSLTADTELSWPTELATDTNVASKIMNVTATAGPWDLIMPAANDASVGETVLIFNVGSNAFVVTDNGGNTIVSIAPGLAYQLYLTDNTTVNGIWSQVQYGAGTSSATAGSLAGLGIKAIGTTLNQSMSVSTISVNYSFVVATDRSGAFVWTGGAGTLTLPLASNAGNDWFVHIRNNGTGAITLTPSGSDLINGSPTLIFNPDDSAIVACSGTGWYSIGFGQAAEFTFDYDSIDLSAETTPYTLSGGNLNRIAYSFGGAIASNFDIIVPTTIQQYWVTNNTTGGFSLTVKTAAGSGITISNGESAILYCNGTNVVDADTAGVAYPISVANGGTGATNATDARTNLSAAKSGVNGDITQIAGLSDGGASGPAVTFLSESNTGMYRSAAGALSFSILGTLEATLTASGLTLANQLTVPNGGTGITTATTNGVLYGNGTSALGVTAAGTTGQVLVGNTGGAPSWATLSGIGVTSFSAGTTGLTPSVATTGAITLAGTLGVANGGTGTATQFTAGSVVFAGASGVYSQDNANLFWDDSNDRLGIGTSSPSVKLDVRGPLLVRETSGGDIYLRSSVDGGNTPAIQVATNSPLAFYTNNTEKMRIDASGNVGIGTSSPAERLSVWGSGTTSTIADFTNGVNANFQIKSASALITVGSSATAPLAFQTNATERMRIDSSGNVGIGTSSPGHKLDVVGSGTVVKIGSTSALNAYAAWQYNGSILGYVGNGAGVAGGAGATDFAIGSTGARPLVFGTNDTERMRIDASGNLLVGQSSLSITTVGASIEANGTISSTRSGSTNATSTLNVYSTGAGAYRFYVDMAGTVFATSTTISAISDIRLKENVRELDAGLDVILALKPRRFDWKEGKGKDVKDDMGFIAQEVEEVLPALIGGWKAGEGEPDDLKSVKAGDLIPVLVKAIQELTARVAQLEGK